MRKLVLVVIGLSIIMPLYAKKPKPKHPDPVLCGIRSVFVEGNNPSASEVRKRWKARTGIVVVKSVEEADAILEVSRDSQPYQVQWPAREMRTKVFTNVILKSAVDFLVGGVLHKAGEQLWTGTGENRPGDLFGPLDWFGEESVSSVIYDFVHDSDCE